jgi:hypothetical protein
MRDHEERKLIAFAVKWHAGFKCQICGSTTRELSPIQPESHHNTYGHDRPKDFLCLCSACHALVEWRRKEGRKMTPALRAQLKRLGGMRVSLAMIDDYLARERDWLIDKIDKVEWRMGRLLALAEGWQAANEWRNDQEGEQRRAA